MEFAGGCRWDTEAAAQRRAEGLSRQLEDLTATHQQSLRCEIASVLNPMLRMHAWTRVCVCVFHVWCVLCVLCALCELCELCVVCCVCVYLSVGCLLQPP